MMGKNRERVRFCFIAAPDAAKTNLGRTRGGKNQGGPQFIASERITPRGGPRLPNPLRRATGFRQDTVSNKIITR